MMAELNAPSLAHEITLQITLTDIPQLRFRLWLFKGLMRLAVWVGGFGGVEFIEAKDD